MSKRCELQKEYYQDGNYKGSGKYSDDYVKWLENEVLALRQPLVIKYVCNINELDCPCDFTSRCTYGRCDCKPKQTVL